MLLFTNNVKPNKQTAANIISAHQEDKIGILSRHFDSAATSIFDRSKHEITVGNKIVTEPGDNKHMFAIVVSGDKTGHDDSRAVSLVNKLKEQGFKGKISVENNSYNNPSGNYTSVMVKGALEDLLKVAKKQQALSSKGRSL
jgi:hypothetical protein